MEDISLEVPDNEDYGVPCLEHAPSQLMRELFCYRYQKSRKMRAVLESQGVDIADTRVKSAFQHMVNAIQILWPEEVAIYNRGYRNTNFLEVIESLCLYDDLGIAGNASSGKSFGVSVFCVADWLAAPDCTSSYVATTTLTATEDRLWGSVADLFRAAKKRLGSACVGTLVDYKKCIVYGDISSKDEDREYRNCIKAVAFPKGGEGQKAVAEMRGRKNARVRLFEDELAEMESHALTVRVNLSANPEFLFCGIANPSNEPNNPHKELCEPRDPRGWDSVNKDMAGWETRTGYCIFLSGERNPNFQVGPDEPQLFPGILSWKSLEMILKNCYGNRNSIEYWRNAIGFWAGTEVEQTVISKSFIINSETNYEPVWTPDPIEWVVGFDTGFTAGGDKCVASLAKLGIEEIKSPTGKFNIPGRKVGFYHSSREYHADVGEVFEDSIARKLVTDLRALRVNPSNFGMDISGDGGKMLQAIIKEWARYDERAMDVYAISSMGSPSDRQASAQEKLTCAEKYDRRVTEYWFSIRNAIGAKVLLGLDAEKHRVLLDEMCARIYYNKGKKVAIERKDEMKLRIKRSPDTADSFSYMVEMLRRAGMEFITPEQFDERAIPSREKLDMFERRYITHELEDEGPDEEEYSYSGGGSGIDED